MTLFLHPRHFRHCAKPALGGLCLAIAMLAGCSEKPDPRDVIPQRPQEEPVPNVLSPVVVTPSGSPSPTAPDPAPESTASAAPRDVPPGQPAPAAPRLPDARPGDADPAAGPVADTETDRRRDTAVAATPPAPQTEPTPTSPSPRRPAAPPREPVADARPVPAPVRGPAQASESGGSTAGAEPSISRSPLQPRDLNSRAIVLINADAAAEAIPLLEQAVQMQPRDPEFLGNLGYAYMRAGRYSQARDHLLAARDASPRRSATWLNLGQTYAELGDPQLAVRTVLTGYELSSRRESVRSALATAATSGRQSPAWRDVARAALEEINREELGASAPPQ
ncbi:MAG: hypothetical protein AVDCRST_MAG71-3001 [uncultured Lysobacter sp.]|uniref:Uncharacterized protein n=1 Tax=uncultured Lysobacter sp. TaxID=271060 RepID=A0A6J4M7L3_9GAMM|nr:MAG: hypothetical protein AVDCRST_MAG71-3001 [uncultured Lysobacter sp.]